MSDQSILWLCILVAVVGLSVMAGIVVFASSVFKRRVAAEFPDHPFFHEFFHFWVKEGPHRWEDIPRHLAESYAEYLQRRNEFWTTYGQVLIAVLIVTVLAILLIAKAISAEAGLPILSGISGFAIAKGVSGSKTISVPQERISG